jgi:prevent-host-death family protein
MPDNKPMPTVTIRELQRETARVLREAEQADEPTVVTRRGRPAFVLQAADWEDVVLATAREYIESRARADADYAAGRTRDYREVFAEIDAERAAAGAAPKSRVRRTRGLR